MEFDLKKRNYPKNVYALEKVKCDQPREIPCYQAIQMFHRVDKCLKGKYRCYGRCNSLLHVKLSVRTMVLQNNKEAKQLFRYANEMFIKAKSDIRNRRNVVTWYEGVLLNICYAFEFSLLISLQRVRKDEAVWCWGSHAFIEHPARHIAGSECLSFTVLGFS